MWGTWLRVSLASASCARGGWSCLRWASGWDSWAGGGLVPRAHVLLCLCVFLGVSFLSVGDGRTGAGSG